MSDGRLVSVRSQTRVWDHAFHSLEQSQGSWEFDAMLTESFNNNWQFELGYVPGGNSLDTFIEGSTEQMPGLLVVFSRTQIDKVTQIN